MENREASIKAGYITGIIIFMALLVNIPAHGTKAAYLMIIPCIIILTSYYFDKKGVQQNK